MEKLEINLKNCYGIQSLEYEFNLKADNIKSKHSAYAIYAPNGMMKTSFSRTFEDLSNGKLPREERYNHATKCIVNADDTLIDKGTIYVLKSEIDISIDSPSITNILVDPKNKSQYDEILSDLDKTKKTLLKELATTSGLKQTEVEQTILKNWQEENFPTCIQKIRDTEIGEDLSPYKYSTIFDPRALDVLNSHEFITKAKEFNTRYQELFEHEGSIYEKGVFNPKKAETAFKTLKKEGFFVGGHRVHLRGDDSSISEEELEEKLRKIHANIDGDVDLKKIKNDLARNIQTDELASLIEALATSEFEYLLEYTKPENQSQFQKQLWTFYITKIPSADVYLTTYESSKDQIQRIESEAAQSVPRWEKAISLFNDRFIDMPFKLTIANQAQTVLGREKAILNFIFKDDPCALPRTRDNVRTSLSQGERRALYLLNFIFDVEDRKMNSRQTVFILDDIADSFDYKNKHAILQYLRDLTEVDFFHQIILTHNFDFFRALSCGNGGFVHRERCLMTSKTSDGISLSTAEGISNYFVNKWKRNIMKSNCILYATIPFTRNIIEYTKPNHSNDSNYLKLTSLLHWKSNTDQILVGDYLSVYDTVFNTTHDAAQTDRAIDVLYAEANNICTQTNHSGLNLEDKVVLSIAIRISAEKFLTNKIRCLKNDDSYWYQGTSDQFRGLFEEYKRLQTNVKATEMRTLEKVGITVNSNIHLNSFMYEPILDLTIDHLIALYKEVQNLNV